MSILQIFNLSVLAVKKNGKLALLWFGASLVTALVSSLPLNSFLNTTIGNSLESLKLAEGMDYTVFTDLMNNYGVATGSIMNASILMVLLFMVFNLFFQAGWMASRAQAFLDDQTENIWPLGAQFFLRFLLISILFTVFQGVWLFICFQFFMNMTNGMNVFTMESEQVITQSLWIFVLLLVIGNTLLRLASDYTKAHVVNESKGFSFKILGTGFRAIFRKLGKVFGLYGLILVSMGAIWGVYTVLAGFIPEDSSLAFIGFLIFQVYAFFRIVIRMVHMASVVQVEKLN
ncbi:MAG: hypothetical protein AAFV80_01280 [Bacteroidota bacterium]